MRAFQVISLLLATIMYSCANVEARYVTRASRNLIRHTRKKLERQYGQGLVGLIHPVTKEFNHAAVINQRGGRFKSEHLSDTKSIGLNHAFAAAGRFFAEDEEEYQKIENVDGTLFDRYDVASFTYGWIFALQNDPGKEEYVSSNCFLAAFDMVQQLDYFAIDLANYEKTKNYYNLIAYTPTRLQGNAAATYEYCNMYVYVTQLSMLVSLDFGFLSELTTRWSLLISTEAEDFLADMYDLIYVPQIVDWFLVGFRWGQLWSVAFDVKLTP